MKKSIATFIFVLFAFGATLANDGSLPNGGKTCTSNCLAVEIEQTPEKFESKTIFSFFKTLIELF